jgi:hypothetical protein
MYSNVGPWREPDDHDALIVANTIHVLSVAHNVALVRNMRVHAAAGARLLLVDWWTDPTHTQPPAASLISGEFLVITGHKPVMCRARLVGQTAY